MTITVTRKDAAEEKTKHPDLQAKGQREAEADWPYCKLCHWRWDTNYSVAVLSSLEKPASAVATPCISLLQKKHTSNTRSDSKKTEASTAACVSLEQPERNVDLCSHLFNAVLYSALTFKAERLEALGTCFLAVVKQGNHKHTLSEVLGVTHLMASHMSRPILTQFLACLGSDTGSPDTQ